MKTFVRADGEDATISAPLVEELKGQMYLAFFLAKPCVPSFHVLSVPHKPKGYYTFKGLGCPSSFRVNLMYYHDIGNTYTIVGTGRGQAPSLQPLSESAWEVRCDPFSRGLPPFFGQGPAQSLRSDIAF